MSLSAINAMQPNATNLSISTEDATLLATLNNSIKAAPGLQEVHEKLSNILERVFSTAQKGEAAKEPTIPQAQPLVLAQGASSSPASQPPSNTLEKDKVTELLKTYQYQLSHIPTKLRKRIKDSGHLVEKVEHPVRLSNKDLKLLIEYCPYLRELDLTNCDVSDAGLEEVSKLSQLQTLNLSFCDINFAGFEEVAKLAQLRSLTFSMCEEPDVVLAEISKLSLLERLVIVGTQRKSGPPTKKPDVSDAGLAEIAKLSHLKELSLHLRRSNASAAGLAILVKLSKIESLTLGCQISNQELAEIVKIPQLKSMRIMSGENISDEGLLSFSKATQLQELELSSCKITDAGLPELTKLAKLNALRILFNGVITDAGLDILAKHPTLKSLYFYFCNKITQSKIQNLSETRSGLNISAS